ncbi:MAG: zinc ribbon domain-containing protein [Acidobacteria bacterium]|nr:zinc ribbon domain-containing protein [Acidobacteriota bacterium]
MNCPKCGQGVPDKAAFCIHCGYRFPADPSFVPPPPRDPFAPYSPDPAARKPFQPLCITSFISGIASLLLLLMGFCCGLFALVSFGLAITAVVLGVMGRKHYDPALHRPDSLSLGKIGLILGIVGLTLFVVGLFIMLLVFGISFLAEMGRLG